jgi:hypothetical protein
MDQYLVGVLIGWGLNELSQVLRIRRERRVPVGRALSQLLEARDFLLVTREISQALTARPKAPHGVGMAIRAIAPKFVPLLPDRLGMYMEALTEVAGLSPVLAFRLRGSGPVMILLEQLRCLMSADPAAVRHWEQLGAELKAEAYRDLDRLIRVAARHHGWRTWLDVCWVLRKGSRLPPDHVDRIREATEQFAGGAPGGRTVGGVPPDSV